jgi:hypothetical protein
MDAAGCPAVYSKLAVIRSLAVPALFRFEFVFEVVEIHDDLTHRF